MSRNYPYIRAWGRHMGSLAYYIDGQIERAIVTQAPADAIFENYAAGGVKTGTWSTMAELATTNPTLHAQLTAEVEGA